MKGLLRRIRGAVGLGLIWAVGGWCLGMLIELIYNFAPGFPLGPLVDIWPALLALVGFVGGAVSSTVIAIAGGCRRFDQLTLPGFAAWGALGGLLLGMLIVTATRDGAAVADLWSRAAVILGITTLGSAIAAAGSLFLARMADERELVDAGAEVADAGLTESEARELLGGESS